MDTRLNVAAVMSAMAEYADAQKRHDEAYDRYEGRSWDWWGSEYIRAVEGAKQDAQKVLDDYINLKIAQELEEHIRNG